MFTNEEVLKIQSMGYRLYNKNFRTYKDNEPFVAYAKPIGYNLFVLTHKELICYFKGTNDKILIWSSDNKEPEEDVLEFIKQSEDGMLGQFRPNSNFEFISLEDILSSKL